MRFSRKNVRSAQPQTLKYCSAKRISAVTFAVTSGSKMVRSSLGRFDFFVVVAVVPKGFYRLAQMVSRVYRDLSAAVVFEHADYD